MTQDLQFFAVADFMWGYPAGAGASPADATFVNGAVRRALTAEAEDWQQCT